MESKQALSKARELIKQKQYDKARHLLKGINHPKAKEWLQKLDAMRDKNAGSSSRSQKVSKGAKIKTYGINILALIPRIIFGITAFPLSVFMAWGGFDTSMDIGFPPIVIIFLALLVFAGGFVMLTPALAAILNKPEFILYENGIDYKSNKEIIFYPWDKLEAVQGYLLKFRWLFFTVGSTGAYKFFSNDEVIFKFDSIIENSDELYINLNEMLIKTHVPKLLQQVKEGETVNFMDMEVNMRGLTFSKKHLPLFEVNGVIISEGFAKINKTNGKQWIRHSLDNVYNPFVFQALVHILISDIA